MDANYQGFVKALFDHGIQDWDGGELQDLGAAYGVLRKEARKVPCGDCCACSEVCDPGEEVECYRFVWMESPPIEQDGDNGTYVDEIDRLRFQIENLRIDKQQLQSRLDSYRKAIDMALEGLRANDEWATDNLYKAIVNEIESTDEEGQKPTIMGVDMAVPGSDRTGYACPKHGVILYGNRCLNCERESRDVEELDDFAEFGGDALEGYDGDAL